MPPVNALRLALHPSGLAPSDPWILAEWSAYLLRRLDDQMLAAGDAGLARARR